MRIESFEDPKVILGGSSAEDDAVDSLLFRAYYSAGLGEAERAAVMEKPVAVLRHWRWLERDRMASMRGGVYPWSGDIE